MKKFDIDNLVRKVIEESLQEKADELEEKLKSKVDEWNPNGPVQINAQPDDIAEEDDFEIGDYIMDKLERECSDNPDSESCRKHKEYAGMEMDEELVGGQKKLDKNKNGKLDSEDFKMLRKDKSKGKEVSEGGLFMSPAKVAYSKGYEDGKEGEPFNDDFTSYMYEEMGEEVEEAETVCEQCGSKMNEGVCEQCSSGEMEEGGMEEGNAFTGALAKAKESGKDEFEVGGKKFHVKESKQKKKSVKESFQLSESEMIDLIEKIVLEQKKAKGLAQTEKVLKASKKENDDAIKAVTKKMKEYLKDMSRGEYSMNPEDFPKSNHQMDKDNDTMSYHPSTAVDEYIDAFAHPGQTNLTFDEIKPDDKRIEKYLKGDSTTGNSQKYANAVKTNVGDKFHKNFKDNLYGAEQKNASYKRQPQPVDVAGPDKVKGSLKKLRSKTSKAENILDKLEESENKKTKKINEEFERIQSLMNYNKNTQ